MPTPAGSPASVGSSTLGRSLLDRNIGQQPNDTAEANNAAAAIIADSASAPAALPSSSSSSSAPLSSTQKKRTTTKGNKTTKKSRKGDKPNENPAIYEVKVISLPAVPAPPTRPPQSDPNMYKPLQPAKTVPGQAKNDQKHQKLVKYVEDRQLWIDTNHPHMEEQIAMLHDELKQAMAAYSFLKNKQDGHELEVQMLKNQNQLLQTQLKHVEEKCASSEKTRKEAVKFLEGNIKQLQTQLKTANSEKTTLQDELNKLNRMNLSVGAAKQKSLDRHAVKEAQQQKKADERVQKLAHLKSSAAHSRTSDGQWDATVMMPGRRMGLSSRHYVSSCIDIL